MFLLLKKVGGGGTEQHLKDLKFNRTYFYLYVEIDI